MAAPRLPKDDPATAVYLTNLRKLVAEHGVNETARRVGRSRQNVSEISRGIRYRKVGVGQLTVDQLGIRRGSGKLCRKCGRPCHLVIIKSIVCVECGLLDLIRAGVIKVASEEDTDETS
jgi:hypothetical protein